MFAPFWPPRTNRKTPARPAAAGTRPRLHLESIEDRLCPSQGSLIVGSYGNNGVLRYDEGNGAFVDRFDPHNLGSLKNPVGGVVGPDGNLYVSSSIFEGNHPGVLRYDGT